MGQRNLWLGVMVALLVSCAQTPQKSNGTPTLTALDAQQVKIVKQVGPLTATHQAAQDITYNSHYPPVFPPQAIREKHIGTVVLMIHVGANGEVGDIRSRHCRCSLW